MAQIERCKSPPPLKTDNSGKCYCTPQGVAIASLPIYMEYYADPTCGTGRYRGLVHTEGSEWWLCRDQIQNLSSKPTTWANITASLPRAHVQGKFSGWMFCDNPPRQWAHLQAHSVDVGDPLPFLHRRGAITNLEKLYALFMSRDIPVKQLFIAICDEACKKFRFDLRNSLSDSLINHRNIPKCLSDTEVYWENPEKKTCSLCGETRVIVSKITQQYACNYCSRKAHAKLKLYLAIPPAFADRIAKGAFSAFVDRCLTIEESLNVDAVDVMDYRY